MSKFNARVPSAPDQALAQAPVKELREQTPEPSGSVFDELSPAVQEAVGGPSIAEIEAQQDQQIDYDLQSPEALAQRQEEAITPIHQRREEERVDKFEIEKDEVPQVTADFGLEERAKNLINKSKAPEIVDRIAISGIAPVMKSVGANRNNDAFLKTLSYVTENYIADLALGDADLDFAALSDAEKEAVDSLPYTEGGKRLPQQTISKASGNQKLGQEIHRDFQRLMNSLEGRPTDDYQDLSPEEATVLGDAAKELYYESNKNNMERIQGKDGQVYFVPSSKLQDEYAKGAQFRKRIFPKQHVRPTKTPVPQGRFVGEGQKLVKGTSGKVGKGSLNDRQIQQARTNLNKVGNVVDKQRLRILYSTILPALMYQPEAYGTDPLLDAFSEINNFGPSKLKKFKGIQRLRDYQGKQYDWKKNMSNLKTSIAQSLLGIAQERNGVNYLTYDMQAFNGRLSPQQTHFDPTTSKAVRFVTRNPKLVTIEPGSRQERNLLQMYSLIIADKGTDALLPKGRVQELMVQAPKLEAWGLRLQSVLKDSISDEDAETISQLIEQNVPLQDPRFQQAIKPLGLDPNRDADLLKAIKDKGEDGPAFIDGLIDFAKYQEAKRRGVSHITGFNAYIDGKTNGIASNGIQMGSRAVAMRTGVLRDGTSIYAVDQDVDIRDQMMDIMTQAVKQQGFDGYTADDFPELYTLAEALVSNRDLAKSTTMTFGYGKNIENFAQDLDEKAFELAQDDPNIQFALDALNEAGIDWKAPILSKFAEGLEKVMSKEAIESRHIMWGVAAMNAAADELMTMTSPTGLELRFGNTETAGESGDATKYKIYGEGTTEARQVGARHYETKATSAAFRSRTKEEENPITGEIEKTVTRESGGKAWGGAVPGPVQALDAATVAMSVTGESWHRLNKASKGKPYIHSIYDAFKMDANGYDVVLEEVNRNWLKAASEWSYLVEARESYRKAEAAFNDKLKKYTDDQQVDLREEFPFFADLLDPSQSSSGSFPNKLYKKVKALMEFPADVKDPEDKHNMAIDEVNRILETLGLKLSGTGPQTMSAKKIRRLQKMLFNDNNIPNRMNKLIDKTERDKKELLKEIRKNPETVYQYYTH